MAHVLGEDVSHTLIEEDLESLVLGPGVSEEQGLRPKVELGAGKFLLSRTVMSFFLFIFLFLLAEFFTGLTVNSSFRSSFILLLFKLL